jgi:hypothetical protein
MSKRILFSIVILVFSIVSCTENTVEPPKNESIINGTFMVISSETDSKGKPIKNTFLNSLDSVKIYLEQNNFKIDSTYTQEGSFSFKNLGAGKYRLRAYINEMIFKTSELLETNGSDTIAPAPIPLSIFSSQPAKLKIENVFPNPITDSTNIILMINENSNVKIYLINLQGKILENLFENEFVAGKYEINYKFSLLPGTYFLVAQTKDYYSYTNFTKNP